MERLMAKPHAAAVRLGGKRTQKEKI